jgi:hypothetical protein
MFLAQIRPGHDKMEPCGLSFSPKAGLELSGGATISGHAGFASFWAPIRQNRKAGEALLL